MNLSINQELIKVIETDISRVTIQSIRKDKEFICGQISLKTNGGHFVDFDNKGHDGSLSGTIEVNYQNYKKFTLHESIEEAAVFVRNNFLKKNEELRKNIEKSMETLKSFREKNYELLYMTDTDKWIENFKREYQW